MAGPALLPPFSFWAASISCLLISASSMAFFLASASKAFFSASAFLIRSSSSFFFLANSFSCSALISFLLDCFSFSLLSSSSSLDLFPGQLLLLLSSDLLPLGLFLLQPLELILLLGPLVPPLCDVFPQLLIQLILLHASFPLSKCLVSLGGGVGGV